MARARNTACQTPFIVSMLHLYDVKALFSGAGSPNGRQRRGEPDGRAQEEK